MTNKGQCLELGEEKEDTKKTVEINTEKDPHMVQTFFGYYNTYGLRALGCKYISKKNFILINLMGILRLRHVFNTNEEEKKKWQNPEELNKLNYKMEEQKEDEINTDKKEKKEEPKNERICYSKIYCSTYNNINGEPHEENYTSQSIKQINNEHNISETKELYKNSNGIQKTAYQRGLDGKTTRFIKEKNIKTGKNNEKKVIKGIEENEIKDFNKEYNNYSKKYGFRKNIHDLFEPFGFGTKQLNYRNEPMFLHRLLF